MTQFPPHFDDEKKRQYAEFMEAQRKAEGKIVPLKTGKVRALDLVERSKKSRLELTAKREATEAAKPLTAGEIEQLVFQPTEALPTVMHEFSLQQRTPDLRDMLVFERTLASLSSLGIAFSYDLFRDRFRVGGRDLQLMVGESIDNAILVLCTTVMQRFRFDPSTKINQAVHRLCIENSFNPVLDYLNGLTWDGKPRLDTWLSTYLGADDDPLNRAMGRKVLIAAVRRVRVPGTKFDQMDP